jgi:hypothetical protein
MHQYRLEYVNVLQSPANNKLLLEHKANNTIKIGLYKKSPSFLKGSCRVQGRLITSNIIMQDLEEIGNFR